DAREPGRSAELLAEIAPLLNVAPEVYDSVPAKHDLLDSYLHSCLHNVSGQRIQVKLTDLAEDLEQRAYWLTDHLRRQEWIDGGSEGWFNSYYDNDGQAVEGFLPNGVRMMLTGQVFAIMGQVADKQQISAIARSADHYLYQP